MKQIRLDELGRAFIEELDVFVSASSILIHQIYK